MPIGRTHDRITLWSLPVITASTLLFTRSSHTTLIISSGYLFSGLMFGPDLDIHSRQFIRWGIFRIFWLPYQRFFRHRSFFSHGIIIGTVIRCLYLSSAILFIVLLIMTIGEIIDLEVIKLPNIIKLVQKYWQRYPLDWLSLFIGLELGALSHTMSDWGKTTIRKVKTKGLHSVIPKFQIKKKRSRKPSTNSTRRKSTTPRKPRTRKSNINPPENDDNIAG
jgi:uncharacterized metal-binding protein